MSPHSSAVALHTRQHRSARAPLRRTRVAGLAIAGALLLAAAPAPAEQGPADGLHLEPSIFWKLGDQRIDLSLESRFRTEWWDAHAVSTEDFYAVRSRVGLRYSYAEKVILFAQFQDARIWHLAPDTSGAGATYRTYGGRDTQGDDIRQVWAEVHPIEGLGIRGGRQDIELGTAVLYPEPNWKYLKTQRVSQRLVGGVGWTHGERSNDGASAWYDAGEHKLYGWVAQPTTGVFDISSGYQTQDDILYGGLEWTAKRGALLDNTEVRGFFIGYGDDRRPVDGGMLAKTEIYTLGFSALGVYPAGPGNFDLLLWGAGQSGRFMNDDHLAGAGILEAGYQLPDVWSKPWLRTGVNVASGGGSEDDGSGSGDHNTFFNILPTNHLYYGFADQFAFQNLIDLFGQLKVQPHERLDINLMAHQFWLVEDDDRQYFGSGAFTKRPKSGNFGYGSRPSGGDHAIGTELDVVASVKVTNALTLEGGYAHIWDGDVFENNFAHGGVNFGYLQVMVKY